MRLLEVERLVLNLTKRKDFFFSTFRKRTKNEKYDDLETSNRARQVATDRLLRL